MGLKRLWAAVLALCLLPVPKTRAAEVDSGDIYCFSAGDFSGEGLRGICITGLPEAAVGTVYLGDRAIRPGDVLAADQLEQLTFRPVRSEADAAAAVTYLPVLADGVGSPAELTISIRGKENQAPVAEDFAAETYKNLPIRGNLKVKDPEGENMTFTILRQPKRGQVEIGADGSFTYTPKKNKVGIDSFVFTATDAAGKVSRETTVTITIVKPTDAPQYTDTVGLDCRFAAEWMKNTGIFVGETLDGNACFRPEQAVTRGEFLAMLVRTLEIPRQEPVIGPGAEQIPVWLQPYVAAALRAGLTAGLPEAGYDEPISGPEAAVMIQNALDLTAAEETAALEGTPEWAGKAVNALAEQGISLDCPVLTRADAARALYETSRLAREAPGMVAIAREK